MNTPEPQGYLGDEAKQIYYEMCSMLEDVDALEEVDSYGLSMAAHWLYLYQVAADNTTKDGGTQMTKTGYSQITAHLTVMKTASAAFKDLAAKYGLSVKDRELIHKFKTKRKDVDALDEL